VATILFSLPMMPLGRSQAMTFLIRAGRPGAWLARSAVCSKIVFMSTTIRFISPDRDEGVPCRHRENPWFHLGSMSLESDHKARRRISLETGTYPSTPNESPQGLLSPRHRGSKFVFLDHHGRRFVPGPERRGGTNGAGAVFLSS